MAFVTNMRYIFSICLRIVDSRILYFYWTKLKTNQETSPDRPSSMPQELWSKEAAFSFCQRGQTPPDEHSLHILHQRGFLCTSISWIDYPQNIRTLISLLQGVWSYRQWANSKGRSRTSKSFWHKCNHNHDHQSERNRCFDRFRCTSLYRGLRNV